MKSKSRPGFAERPHLKKYHPGKRWRIPIEAEGSSDDEDNRRND